MTPLTDVLLTDILILKEENLTGFTAKTLNRFYEIALMKSDFAPRNSVMVSRRHVINYCLSK